MSGYISEITEQPTDPIGGASGHKRKFHVMFMGKEANDEFPFTVSNEIVATQIGQALGLNLPTVFPHRVGDKIFALVQLVDRLVPATSAELQAYVDSRAREIHGAIVFDLFIANNDRAFGPVRRNLALDLDGRLLLYDQGNACFYRNRPKAGIAAGIPRLKAVEADFGCLFDMKHKENHYFQFLTDWSFVREWCGRIRELPDYLIEAAVDRIPKYMERPTAEERQALVNFLVARKSNLLQDIDRHRALFPGLPRQDGHA